MVVTLWIHFSRQVVYMLENFQIIWNCTMPDNKGCRFFLTFHSTINFLPFDFLLPSTQITTIEPQTPQRISLSVEGKACILGMKVASLKTLEIVAKMKVLARQIQRVMKQA